ncbi:MAG: GntR family transcriptional regulator [Lachnospiraceae bacterium]|nr:GntR family transcriptional regulator [Lachnospiraceae bacterium]
MKSYTKYPRESARDYALRVLKENIISLELKPGTVISENELAAKLGISRTPIREAIIELGKTNLIETYPQRGSYITLIDPKMVEEARFLRKITDTAVIEEACDEVDEEGLAKLEENVTLQEFYLSKGMTEKIFDLDNQFHKDIYTIAKKDIIYTIHSMLMIHFDRVRNLSVETVKDFKVVTDHRNMLEAIRARDKVTAVALVNKHLNRYKIDEQEIRKQRPEYFKEA